MIKTDIFNSQTPEFFINMKSIPDKNSVDRKDFVLEEKRKGREGINVNGIYIPGNLYFHLNFYRLSKDIQDNQGKTLKVIDRPDFRDVDWIIFNDYHKATIDNKIYTLFGLRQIGKSEIEVSLCLRELSLYANTEAIALFSSAKDKDTFVKKARLALEHGEKFIFIPNIDKDWSKEEIRFGFTKSNNDIDLRGLLYIYLTKEGKNVQVASGKTPTFALFDEIAKSPYRLVYEALEPALQDDFGNLRCAPIKTFTGGEVDKSVDAENLVTFPNPDKQMIYDVDGKDVGGRFLSGLYRKDCKVDTNFSDFIGKKTGTWLDTYNIRVSDFQKARDRIEKDLEAARKLPDPRPLIFKRIFNPLSIADVFLQENKNPFDIQALERHKDFLLRNPVGTAVDIYKDSNGVIQIAASRKSIIQEYPVRDKMIELDAPIVIYDHPKYERYYALHVMGFDPIHQDESTGDSLASIYIMRRNHTDIEDPFRDTMVASYTARHKSLTKGYMKNVELLQEYYNCQILHEAGPNSVFTYFDKILKTDVLMDTFQLQKSINDKTKATSSKGLPATVANNAARLQVLINYLEEDLGNGVLGYTRILDPLLIDELIAFDGMGKGTRNTDRIDAFTLALIQITSLERFNQLRPFVTHLEIKDTPKRKQPPLRNSMGIVNRKSYRNSIGL